MKPLHLPILFPRLLSWAPAFFLIFLFMSSVASAQTPVFQNDAMTPEEADAGPADNGPEEPAVEPRSSFCADAECPATAADWIFYRYGQDCAGLDWRFLRAVAKAESGLDPHKRAGGRVGLFQIEPQFCSQNLGPFVSFLNCSELEDPETNTAAVLNGLHRYLAGRKDLGGQGGFPAILSVCPDNAPTENILLAYVGLKLGPGVLRHVLANRACKDEDIRKALISFYVGYMQPRLEQSLDKYADISKFAARLDIQGRLYLPQAFKTTLCPAVTGKRLFSREELKKTLSAGSFKDQPLVGPAASALFSEESLFATVSKTRDVSPAPKNEMARALGTGNGPTPASDGTRGDTHGRTGVGGGESHLPRSQLPRSLRTKTKAPPPPLPDVLNNPVEINPIEGTLSGPTISKYFYFFGRPQTRIWTAVYADGTSIKIAEPAEPDPSLLYHTAAQAADAARYLPKVSRALIKMIVINPVINPNDEYSAKEYKEPDYKSYMSARPNGEITIYPNKNGYPLPNDNFMRVSLIHELGHIWSFNKWGTDIKSGKWLIWKKAMDDDQTRVSEYAKVSIMEDIAETFKAYCSTLGSPSFKKYKKQLPHRFAMLAEELN